MALHSPQPCSHLSVRHSSSMGVSRRGQGCLGCQGYLDPRVGLEFGTQFDTCWTQQSTQKGLLTAKTPLDSEMVPPFLQNTLYLEVLSALKFPWQVWASELAGMQDTQGCRMPHDGGSSCRSCWLHTPHSPARPEEGEYRNQCSTLSLG